MRCAPWPRQLEFLRNHRSELRNRTHQMVTVGLLPNFLEQATCV
jgi:hypothetical protein